MYLSRPKISPTSDQQLAKKPSVPLSRGVSPTTLMVRDPDQVRHPVSRKFTSKWQNEQSAQDIDPATRVGDKGSLPANKY